MRVIIHVEGGGNSKELHSRCRRGYSKLIKKCGFSRRMPSIISGGDRNHTFISFKTSLTNGDPNTFDFLLVDSEDPVIGSDLSPNSSVAWDHLFQRDNWSRPETAINVQAHLMATCMETWLMADPETILGFFGPRCRRNALIPVSNLESRSRDEVYSALIQSTEDCGRNRGYNKGRNSFELLASVDPDELKKNLPHFNRFILSLREKLV